MTWNYPTDIKQTSGTRNLYNGKRLSILLKKIQKIIVALSTTYEEAPASSGLYEDLSNCFMDKKTQKTDRYCQLDAQSAGRERLIQATLEEY